MPQPLCSGLCFFCYDFPMDRTELPSWWKDRRYVHFDARRRPEDVIPLVTSPTAVAAHSFWPLIYFEKAERRWKGEHAGWKRKERPISYAAHLDSHILAYYANKLGGLYEQALEETGLSSVVLAYRKHAVGPGAPGRGKANFHFAADAFVDISVLGDCEVIALDIERFFDSIPHRPLKYRWSDLLQSASLPPDHYAVFKAVTRFAFVPEREIRAALKMGRRRFRKQPSIGMSSMQFDELIRKKGLIDWNRKPYGIPQGLPISGLLANLVLFPIDKAMADAASSVGGSYRRYSDDILIIAPHGKAHGLEEVLKRELDELQLSVQDAKTVRVTFSASEDGRLRSERPLQYLGLEFDGRSVRLRPQTLVRFSKRMLRAVRRARRSAERHCRSGDALRLRRRDLYARYSYMRPHPETPNRRRPRGSFFEYARRAGEELDRQGIKAHFVSQIDRQLRKQWRRLLRLIAIAEGRARPKRK